MRCGNIRIHVEIPIYADKNNCFCDDNHVSYSIPAIRKACETASNLPIIQYDEQGTEKVVGVAQSIKWNPHGFIEVDGQLLFGGTNETVELGRDDYMRCGNIRIHVEIPIYADKNNCFCDDNHVSYSIPAIRKACETASNLPIIQYDEQGTEKVVGVAQSIKWNPHGFIEVDGQLLFGGTNETVELGRDDCVVSMELSTVGLG